MATAAIENALDLDPFNVDLNTKLPDMAEVELVLKRTDETVAAFGALMSGLEAKANEYREAQLAQTRAHFAGLQETQPGVGKVGPSDGAIASVMKAAQQKAEEEAQRFRVQMVADNSQPIDDMQKRLYAAESRMALLARTFPSPVALLAVQRLDDPKRATYHATVAHAGRTELMTHARVAIATGDRALGAAVVARLHELAPDNRPFSPQALATKLVGEEHRQYVNAFKRTQRAFRDARNRVWSLQTGKTTPPIELVKRGLETHEDARDPELGRSVRKEAGR